MATTSLWHIKGRLGDLIDYVENPDKTIPKGTEDFFNVFDYVRRPDKTADRYVDAINCRKEIALQQMILTKKQYGKTDKYIAWHGYQSFKAGEVTPDIAHEIGLKLASEMWGDRFQIVVTTHLDKEHIHNHFAFNSVSFRDGGKYNYSKREQQRLRDVSDRLCREYGLSVITHPHKAPSRPVWLDEKSGKPTRYNVYRKDVTAAFSESTTVQNAERYLQRLGYITDFSGAYWKIRLPQYEHFTRLDTLEERWTPEYLHKHMGRNAPYGSRRAKVVFSPYMPYHYRSYYTPFVRTSHSISDTDSGRQVQRYIRLTYLIPEFLEKMDNGEIALSVGVELSFLDEQSQREVLEQCAVNDCTPSYSQAWRMHKAERVGKLDSFAIMQIMSEEKANQRENIKIPMEKLRDRLPKSLTAQQQEDFILKAVDYYRKYLIRQRDRDSR